MTYTLRISFTGMCLAAREAGKTMRIMLPNTDMMSMSMPPHFAQLQYDLGYLSPTGPGPTGILAYQAFNGLQWDLSGVGSGINTTLPPEVARPQKACKRQMKADLTGLLDAQVILTAGTMLAEPVAMGGPWSWAGHPSCNLAYAAVWTIPGIEGDSFNLKLTSLEGDVAYSDLALYPPAPTKSTPSVIDITLLHLPAAGSDPAPMSTSAGTPAPHFGAYYLLFDDGSYAPPPILSSAIMEISHKLGNGDAGCMIAGGCWPPDPTQDC